MQRTITIGNAGARGLRTYVQLFTVIAHANDVKCDVASNSTFVYAYGFAEDIDASHALYASLVMQMVRASEAYISSGAAPADADHHRADQLPAGLRRPRRPAAGRGPRAGPAGGDQGQRNSRPGTAIALRNKDIELKDFYRETSQARGTWRATSATAGYSSSARRAGDRAGRRARLGNSPELAGRPLRTGAVTPRDTQRAKVYAAEEFVRTLFDRAAEHGNRVVEFFGTQLTLPPEGTVRVGRSRCSATSTTCSRHPAVAGTLAGRRHR